MTAFDEVEAKYGETPAPADQAAHAVDVQWTTAPMSDRAYKRLAALLFGARPADADQSGGDDQ
ncbi:MULTISPECIES: hypothetical protein [unclassified Nocardiopsis]|uniref:hypothetical protein n=1 Tax=Nocardiopsis TaxID=2013 RepID=UPI00387B2AAE